MTTYEDREREHHMKTPGTDEIMNLKNAYPKGTRVMLDYTDDPFTKLTRGDTGTVSGIDDIGTLFISWDNGSGLGLDYYADSYHRIS